MSVEQSSTPSSAVPLSAELEILIEHVVERTLARLANIAQHPFISSKECARLIGVTPEHLSAMRARGDGPPWSGQGKWIRYNRGDVLAWLASLPTQSTTHSLSAALSVTDFACADPASAEPTS